MDPDHARDLLMACRWAERICAMMPELPAGVNPRHLHALDAVVRLARTSDAVRVGDVSSALGVTRPTITRAVADLEALGYVRKRQSPADGRTVVVVPTAAGLDLHARYVRGYHDEVARVLAAVNDEDADTTIRTIGEAHRLLSAAPIVIAAEDPAATGKE